MRMRMAAVGEYSADDLVAILWHQHRVRSFRAIARMTRRQIAAILSRDVDDKGRVEIVGLPRRWQPKVEKPKVILRRYEDIFEYAIRFQSEHLGLEGDALEREIQRRREEHSSQRKGD